MTEQSNRALIVIDLQNDYFPNGKFPLWNTDDVLTNIEFAIESAKSKNIPVILVQHIANAERGSAQVAPPPWETHTSRVGKRSRTPPSTSVETASVSS